MAADNENAAPAFESDADVSLVAELCDIGDEGRRLQALLKRDDFDLLALELLRDAI
jgi:hypothetical protein